jgi:hypothetical protein
MEPWLGQGNLRGPSRISGEAKEHAMSISPGSIDLDLAADRTLTTTIYTRFEAAGPLLLEMRVVTGRSPDFTSRWVSPRYPLEPMEADQTHSVTFGLPPLPDEDFFIAAVLKNDGTPCISDARAYRLREGTFISAGTMEALDDMVLYADLQAGRIDQATYRRRNRELHRRPNTGTPAGHAGNAALDE